MVDSHASANGSSKPNTSIPFSYKDLPNTDHPKAKAHKALFDALAHYHETVTIPLDNERNLSASYLAYESLLKQARSDGKPSGADEQEAAIAESKKFRHMLQESAAYDFAAPPGSQVKPVTYGGVSCYWVAPADMKVELPSSSTDKLPTGKFVVHHHGGGYIIGNLGTHLGVVHTIATANKAPVLFIDYGLAPEYLWPSQNEEALAVHKALLELDSTCTKRMILWGESAGGQLVLNSVQQIIKHQLAPPAVVVSVSPWNDPTCSLPSYTYNNGVDLGMSTAESKHWHAQCQGGNKHVDANSIMNPIRDGASFKGFPPLYLWVGGTEVLVSDSEKAAEMAKKDGVDVQLVVSPHMPHNGLNNAGIYPEATKDMEDCIKWVNSKLSA